MPKYHQYASNGVSVDPTGPSALNIFKINYTGLLVDSGAAEVFAHVGFNANWENAGDYPMDRTSQGFETLVFLHEGVTTLNICFRDPVGNWDNNSGRNYSFALKDKADSLDSENPLWREDLMTGSYYWQE
jgi:hypothetical protein